ncbi:hypothetical protein QQ045_005246 [Rhodiola kirilowii]
MPVVEDAWRIKGGRCEEELRVKLQFLLKEIKEDKGVGELGVSLASDFKTGNWVLCDGSFDSETKRAGWGVIAVKEMASGGSFGRLV